MMLKASVTGFLDLQEDFYCVIFINVVFCLHLLSVPISLYLILFNEVPGRKVSLKEGVRGWQMLPWQ